MAIEFFPYIVIDTANGKTFRQTRLRNEFGKRQYRRARRIMPGIWYTYRNEFLDYPSVYQPLDSHKRPPKLDN